MQFNKMNAALALVATLAGGAVQAEGHYVTGVEGLQGSSVPPAGNYYLGYLVNYDINGFQAPDAKDGIGGSGQVTALANRLDELAKGLDELPLANAVGALGRSPAPPSAAQTVAPGLPLEQQVEGARHVVARGLTVRQTEALVRQWLSDKPDPVEPSKPDPDIARLEQRLAERLGSAVQIRHGNKGKGQLVIRYNSLDELQGVLAHIR